MLKPQPSTGCRPAFASRQTVTLLSTPNPTRARGSLRRQNCRVSADPRRSHLARPATGTVSERIRALNDAFRSSFTGGQILLTASVAALPSEVKAIAIRKIATIGDFTADNDPHGEHGFGASKLAGHKCFSETRPLRRHPHHRLKDGRPASCQPCQLRTVAREAANQPVVLAKLLKNLVAEEGLEPPTRGL